MRARFTAAALAAIGAIASAAAGCSSDGAIAFGDDGADADAPPTFEAGAPVAIDAGRARDGAAPRVDASAGADAAAVDASDASPPPGHPGWTLVWSDEFDGPAGAPVDPSKWAFDVGGNGWGNAEGEYYTDRAANAHLDGQGHLNVVALNEAYKGKDYTSARLKTEGKFAQTFGRFEARARLPIGRGIWPAFWLLGGDHASAGWPACGEIDVMEFIGSAPGAIRGSLHGPGYSGSTALSATYHLPAGQSFHDAYHVFAIEWKAGEIRYYVDEELYQTETPASIPSGAGWPFDGGPFFVILDLAVGGILPGSPDGTTTFPQTLVVDYVRVYRR